MILGYDKTVTGGEDNRETVFCCCTKSKRKTFHQATLFFVSHQQVNKLIKENLKCSCKGKKAPLASKNGGVENSKTEGGPRGSSSSEEGSSPTKATDTEKENVFTASS